MREDRRPPAGLARRVPLSEIDAAVAARLGPGRVTGNAQPVVFSRQVAVYLAKEIGGWSTTKIGRFYNGRDHSTVCSSVRRIEILREVDPGLDAFLNAVANEISTRQADGLPLRSRPASATTPHNSLPVLDDGFLDSLADRIATRVLSKLAGSRYTPSAGF